MEASKELMLFIRFWLRILCHFCVVASVFTHCDARSSILVSEHVSSPVKQNMKHSKILEVAKSLNMVMDVSAQDSSNPQPYVSSPFTLPPYDSLSPMPLPNTNNPPFCVYPPPQTPTTKTPTPTGSSPTPPLGPNQPLLSPPTSPATTKPSPPFIISSPPSIMPGPPESIPSPFVSVPNPPYYEPSPPSGNVPSPPEYVPSPVGFAPSPPIFQPPVVFPPPTVPPPPSTAGGGGGQMRVWCVAKPSVPDPIIQEAMNYACGSGADCGPIQPNGSCFQPNKLLAHASYAFNSYWQRTKVAGGTCDFGGTAILVTMDPRWRK
ncbi:hypothetical protein Cgig2_030138 [Carnegiea gigantea]|uniref:X8 domain-containing protein n=1 Tax=Carnegiea gigantea TaxID=171969 RepID=A0A9Q1K138_9CARY|nr:hypothetical protein Cgig2_030138 [Carnegiea gigantea]